MVNRLTTGQPDDIFVHLDEVDGAGHSTGSSSAAYTAALERADAQIGEMVNAVKSRPSYSQEDWLITITSDHGHTPTGGHGGSTKLERKTFVVAQGAEFAANSWRDDVKITDIAPTVLAHNGIATDAGWDLDGTNVNDIVPDDFDTLRPILKTAAQETGPGQLLGWTDQAPAGWKVDNSKMPTGGAPEYRGWTFMTDDFFSNTELGQFRENNVHSRNVFAVADSDEWDDVNPKGGRNFDSTLETPAYELNGAETVDLSFVSDYAVDGPQGAAVWLHFDEASGIPRQKLIEYPADGTRANPVNKVERETITLPRDANGKLPYTVSLHFSYSGVNSAFWAIDQVRVTQPDAPVTPEPEPKPEPKPKPEVTPKPEVPGGSGSNSTDGAEKPTVKPVEKPTADAGAKLATTGGAGAPVWLLGGAAAAAIAGSGALIAQRVRRARKDA